MTTMTNTIDPDAQCPAHGCARWRCDADHPTQERPTHVAHPSIDRMCSQMRAEGRDELVNYAGASYRDEIAWQVCLEWIADRSADLPTLKSRAYKILYGWNLAPADCCN